MPSKRTNSSQTKGANAAQSSIAPFARRLEVEYRAIADLRFNPDNPRVHSQTQLKKLRRSLQRFGWVVPVIVDRNGQVICGHGRLEAAQALGWKEAPVICNRYLSPEEAKAYLIADNYLAALGEWDRKKLGALFLELSAPDLQFDLEDTGFEMSEIDLAVGEVGRMAGDQASDVVPAEIGPAVSVSGDCWRLGNHIVVCGSALERSTFLGFEGKKGAVCFIDPPYNVPIAGHASGNGRIVHADFAMASGEMTSAQFIQFLTQAFCCLANHTVEGSVHYVCIDWRHLRELLAAGDQAYTSLLNLCVWEKDNGGMGSLYRSQHELIAVFKHGKAPHRNNVKLGKYGRYRTNVWKYPCAKTFSRSGDEGNLLALHATPKPVALVQDALLDCSARGDVVLDTFLGSGTTLIAAERAGRICHGVELEPRFVDVAVRRWQAHTGDQARHASTGKTFDEMRRLRARKGGRHE